MISASGREQAVNSTVDGAFTEHEQASSRDEKREQPASELTLKTPATEKLAVQLNNIQADNNLESFPNERRQELPIGPEDKVSCFSLLLGEGAECKVLNLSRSGVYRSRLEWGFLWL